MKKIKINLIALSLLSATFLQSGCFGSFPLVRSVYDFNRSATSSPFVNNLLFYALCIIPVYEVAGLVDLFIFNLIEFWTGPNPVAMKAGESASQRINYYGVEYEITATQNQMSFRVLSGENAGVISTLRFNSEDNTWSYFKDGAGTFVCSVDPEESSIMYRQYDGPAVEFFLNPGNVPG